MFLNFKSFYFAEGPVTCETVYETECQTSYHLHEVEEDQPKCETQMVSYCWTKSGNRSRDVLINKIISSFNKCIKTIL